MCRALTQEVNTKYRAEVSHKDGNRRTALEYAVHYRHTHTINTLKETRKNEAQAQTIEKRYLISKST